MIEGIDGAGKTTLARALVEALRARGADALATREPTDGPHGRRIRELARSGREGVTVAEEVELFTADRADHVRDELAPALLAGKTIVLDRYYYSTMAYQGARGADPADILRRSLAFAPEPDLVVLMKILIPQALDRIRVSRGDTPDAFEGADYLRRVDGLFESFSYPRVLRADALRPTAELVIIILTEMKVETT